MSKAFPKKPRCIVIAGPNGAGKTTMKTTKVSKETKMLTAAVGRALRHAAKVARKTARIYGTPVYVWKNGKVVAEKP